MNQALRLTAFDWLREQNIIHQGVIPRTILEQGFVVERTVITLVGPSGIWKPRVFDLPLSITSTSNGPYNDEFTPEGFLLYRYRGTDPNHRDNVGLREAKRTRTPLIYFHGVIPGRYVPVWPVFIMDDQPQQLSCLVAIDPAYALEGNASQQRLFASIDQESLVGVRRYVAAFAKHRLHQTSFRERVIAAYSETCALCRLRHRELLDAAHIIADTEPGGDPVIPNGLSLCKIHHAAYDQNILGISPDHSIHVRQDVLDEVDGPMLQHGLKDLHRTSILLPSRRVDQPDRDRLAKRYDEFRKAV